MKVSILQENLNKGFTAVSRIISPKTNLPILANILISAEEGKLKLTATNLETGINIWLPAKKEKAGKFTIPAKDITEFISSLSAGKVELEEKKEKLHVISGKNKAVFNGMSAAEFPQVASLKDKSASLKASKKFQLKAEEFVEAVKAVCFSASIDETRPVLTGIRLSCEQEGLQLVATDGYRLSIKKISLKKKLDIPTLIIPSRAMEEVVRAIEAESEETKEEEVSIAITKEANQIIFSFASVEIVARLIEGEFPDFTKIIPERGESKAIIDREEFDKAIRIASIFARRSANIVRLEFFGEKLIIKANAPELGENEATLPVKYKGKNTQIAFNYRFLQDFLKSFKQEAFSLEISDPLKPGLFKGEKDASFFHVIMPVRLQE